MIGLSSFIAKSTATGSTAAAPAETDSSRDADRVRPLLVDSQDLLCGRRELWIEHGSEMYRLRLTGSGKLYLTK